MKKQTYLSTKMTGFTRLLFCLLILIGINPTNSMAQCTNFAQYPFSAVPAPAAGFTTTLSTCNYLNEYTNVSGVVAGSNFISTASASGAFITVRSGSSGGPVVAFGVTPLNWTSAVAGSHFIHYNTNSSCGTATGTCIITTLQRLASGCTNTSQYPFSSFVAPAVNVTTTITTCQFAGEYNQMTGVIAGSGFTSMSSVAGTFITIRSGTSNGPLIASGVTPLSWNATVAGTYFIHYNTNSSCGAASSCMITSIRRDPPSCTNITQYPSLSFAAPAINATHLITTCQFHGEYNVMTGVAAGSNFVSSATAVGTYISVRSGSFNGQLMTAGPAPLIWTAATAGTYYIHYNTNSSCGTASTCFETSIMRLPPACTNTTLYPSGAITAPAPGTSVNITTCQYQSEYNQINGVASGNTFVSTAGIAGTFITVRSGTFNGPFVNSGTTPLSWTAPSAGTYFIHYNTNSSCGTASICMNTDLQNTTPPPSHCIPTLAGGCVGFGEAITNVQFGSINNTSGCEPTGYTNYYSTVGCANVLQGATIPITVTYGDAIYTENVMVWIDFNNNFLFETSELVFQGVILGGTPSVTGNIEIPGCAPAGNHRMRVRMEFNAFTDACIPVGAGSLGGGEAEDYCINIVSAPIIPAVATNITGPTNATCNTNLNYAVNPGSSGAIQWQYATVLAGPYLDIAGATLTNQPLISSGPATFYLRARFRGQGCTPDAYSNVITIIIGPPPVTFTTSTPSANICRGSDITITANSIAPYSWNTGETTQSITVSPLINSTYVVNVGSLLCVGSGSIDVNIIGGPVADASVATSAAECPEAAKQLLANQITQPPPSSNYTVAAIPYAPVSVFNAGPTGDDQVISGIPIGFNFTFFGNNYSTTNISSNGNIQFSSSLTSWTPDIIPSTFELNDWIGSWMDLSPNAGGSITYGTTTVGALSAFVVSYNNVPYYTTYGGSANFQIMLLSDNSIQIHASNMNNTLVLANKTMGVENFDGTTGIAAPGRNWGTWTISGNEAWEFSIPSFAPFTYVGPVTYSWSDGSSIVSNVPDPIVNPEVTTTYTLTIADNICSSTSSVVVAVLPEPTVTATTLTPYCESNTISFNTNGVGAPMPSDVTVSLIPNPAGNLYMDETIWEVRNASNAIIGSGGPYPINGTTDFQTITVTASDYPLTFTIETNGDFGDNYVDYELTCVIGNTVLVSGTVGDVTGLGGSYTSSPLNCVYSGGGSLDYSWSGPNGFNSTQEDPSIPSATLANNGSYTVVATDGNGCTNTFTTTIVVNANPVMTQVVTPVSCDGFNDGSVEITINGGDQNLFYFVSDDIGNFDFVNPVVFSGYYAGTYNYLVQDGNNCFSNDVIVMPTVPNAAPVISCPADISISADPGVCGAVVNYSTPVGSDVCPIVGTQRTAGLPSGSVFPVGTTVNTFVVTDVLGATATCSFSVTVTDDLAPVITSSVTDFSACNPISWTPLTVADNCPGVQVVSSHTPGTIFPAGTTTVTYTATDVYNNVASYSFDVTVLPASIAADSITSNRDYNNICQGESITLTVNGGELGHQASWNWYSGSCGGTPVAAGVPSITVSPSVTTTYYARAEGFCNNSACAQITVVVSAGAPTTNLVYTSIPAYGAPGITSTISVNPIPGATWYRWTTNNGQINGVLFNSLVGPVETTVPTVQITFVLPQSNYQLRVTAGNACGRTNQANDHIRGTVGAPTSLTGPTQVCPLQTASYTVSSVPSAGSYQWSLIPASAGTISGTGLTRSVTFAAGFTSAQLCVAGVSNFGLVGPAYCISIATNSPAPGAISGNSQPCEGSSSAYTIAAVPGATGYSWTTTIAGATVNPGAGTSATINFPSGAFSGNICVTSSSTCGTSTPTCFAVTSGAPGVPGPISGPVQGICNASNVNYSLSTSDAVSYSWVLPSGATVASGGTTNSVNVNFGPSFTSGTITCIATYACGTASTSITVDGAPTTPVVTPATICPGGDAVYFASSTGATTYNWTITGADYDECTNPPSCSQYYIIWGPAGGSFSVTAQNSCGTSASFDLSTNCRMAASESQIDSRVYPNPTSGVVTVEFTAAHGTNFEMRVTDLQGRTVVMENIKSASGINRHEIDLSAYNKGIYMLHMKDSAGNTKVTRIAVQ